MLERGFSPDEDPSRLPTDEQLEARILEMAEVLKSAPDARAVDIEFAESAFQGTKLGTK
jgi:hypothetical protein